MILQPKTQFSNTVMDPTSCQFIESQLIAAKA